MGVSEVEGGGKRVGRFRVDRSSGVGRGDGTGYGAPREENRSGMLQT